MAIEKSLQEVYRNGVWVGFLDVSFDDTTNELTATVGRTVVAGYVIPQWVVDSYLGHDKPESVDDYEWNSITFWPTNTNYTFPE
jgi:hypothetical protein